MKKLILISITSFLLGSLLTLLLTNYLNQPKENTTAVETEEEEEVFTIQNTVWVSDNGKLQLEFSDNNNCVFKFNIEEPVYAPFTYIEVEGGYVLNSKEDFLSAMSLIMVFGTVTNIKATLISSTQLSLPTKKGDITLTLKK
jgi:hypothetical protein